MKVWGVWEIARDRARESKRKADNNSNYVLHTNFKESAHTMSGPVFAKFNDFAVFWRKYKWRNMSLSIIIVLPIHMLLLRFDITIIIW